MIKKNKFAIRAIVALFFNKGYQRPAKFSIFILGCIVAFFLATCQKETVIKNVPIVHSWSLDSSLVDDNKYLLNSIAINNSLLLVANSVSIWNVIPSNLNKSIDGNYIDFNRIPFNEVPASLGQTIGVSVRDKDHLAIYPSAFASVFQNSVEGFLEFTPTYSSSSTSVKGLFTQPWYTGGNKGGYPVIANKYILAPFECDFNTMSASLALVRIDTTVNPLGSAKYGPQLSIASIKIINTSGAPVGGFFSAAYYDKFFVNVYGNGYRIDTVGNVKKLPIYPTQMFMYNNVLYALSTDANFYTSQDQGETWTVFGSSTKALYFFNVGNDLYGTFGSQLARITLVGGQLTATELDNDGLETNEITSIAKCGKYAFVTTLSGLYYRDTATFNTPKKNTQ